MCRAHCRADGGGLGIQCGQSFDFHEQNIALKLEHSQLSPREMLVELKIHNFRLETDLLKRYFHMFIASPQFEVRTCLMQSNLRDILTARWPDAPSSSHCRDHPCPSASRIHLWSSAIRAGKCILTVWPASYNHMLKSPYACHHSSTSRSPTL